MQSLLFSSSILPPSPLTGSRMTVVDVSNFGDLQVRGCGDQPAVCYNYIVLMLLFFLLCVHEKYENSTPLDPKENIKKNKKTKATDERYRETSPPEWSVLLRYTCRSRPIALFSLSNFSLARGTSRSLCMTKIKDQTIGNFLPSQMHCAY